MQAGMHKALNFSGKELKIKNMNKIFKIIFVSIVLLGLPVVVFGATTADSSKITPSQKYGIDKTVEVSTLPKTVAGASNTFTIVGNVIGVGLGLVGIIFFALTLYAGIYWMTARGDSSRVDKAKDTLESAIFGLIIVMAADAIVNFVFSKLAVVDPKDQACADLGGVCTETTNGTCDSQYRIETGKCGGDAKRVCYVPK